MSIEQVFQVDEINEDLIYQQMFEAIAEELHIDDDSGEETPNLDSLNLLKQEIQQIRNGGILKFKEIMQSRFRQNIEEELQQMSNSEILSQKENLDDQQSQQTNMETKTNVLEFNQDKIQHNQQIQKQKDSNNGIRQEQQDQNHDKYSSQTGQNQKQTHFTNNALKKIHNSQINQQGNIDIQSNQEQHVQVNKYEQNKNQDIQQIINNFEEIVQEQSIDLTTQENQSHYHYISERENSIEKNENKFYINSESISPINKSFKQKEQQFQNENIDTYFSSQNTSKKGSISAVAKVNEKKKQNNTKQIINDIFSLSGIKVGQIKSMTGMGNNLSMNASTAHNRSDFNQSALSQYNQYDSLSSLRPRSPQEQEQYIVKLYQKQQDISEKIKKMQDEKLNLELSALKPNTSLSKNSQKILSQTNYKKPSDVCLIQYKNQIEKRQQKLEEKQKEQQDEELQQCTFHPLLISKLGEEQQQPRSINEFYEQQKNWLQTKNNSILSSQIDQKQKELTETTFHPKINKQSLSQKRNLKVEEKLIQDQEKAQEKRKKMIEQNQPLFKPIILPKSQQLAKKRKEKEFMPCYEISTQYK